MCRLASLYLYAFFLSEFTLVECRFEAIASLDLLPSVTLLTRVQSGNECHQQQRMLPTVIFPSCFLAAAPQTVRIVRLISIKVAIRATVKECFLQVVTKIQNLSVNGNI